jgi:sRNA-binding carbon storage regulator CsrA
MSNIEINENNENNELNSREKLDLLKKEIYQSISKEFNVSNDTAKKLTDLKKDT